MAVRSQTNLINDLATRIIDNTSGQITPAILRSMLLDMIESLFNIHGLEEGQVAALGQANENDPTGMQLIGSTLMMPEEMTFQQRAAFLGSSARLFSTGSFLNIENTVTDDLYEVVDHQANKLSASLPPSWINYAESPNTWRAVYTSITANQRPIQLDGYTFDWRPDYFGRVWGIRFILQGNPSQNVRIRVYDIEDGTPGETLWTFPTQMAWETGAGGVDYPFGLTDIEFLGSTAPLLVDPARNLRFEFRADSGTIAENMNTNLPVFEVIPQIGGRRTLMDRPSNFPNGTLPIVLNGGLERSRLSESAGRVQVTESTDTELISFSSSTITQTRGEQTYSFNFTHTGRVTAFGTYIGGVNSNTEVEVRIADISQSGTSVYSSNTVEIARGLTNVGPPELRFFQLDNPLNLSGSYTIEIVIGPRDFRVQEIGTNSLRLVARNDEAAELLSGARLIDTTGGLTGGGDLSADRSLSIADDGVTSIKLADDAVTSAKIAADAVTELKLLAGAVATDKLADDAVTKAKLNADVFATGAAVNTGTETDTAVSPFRLQSRLETLSYDRYRKTLAVGGTFPAADRGDYVIANGNGTANGITITVGEVYRCTTNGTAVSTPANWDRLQGIEDTGWQALAYASGWAASGAGQWPNARWRKFGPVISVEITTSATGTVTTADTIITTLPVQARPDRTKYFIWNENGQFRPGLIHTDGRVNVNSLLTGSFVTMQTTYQLG